MWRPAAHVAARAAARACAAPPRKPAAATGASVLQTQTTASSSSACAASITQSSPSTDPESTERPPGCSRTCVTASVCTSHRRTGRAARRRSHSSTALCVPTASACSAPADALHTSSARSRSVAAATRAPQSHTRTVPSDDAE